MEQAARFTTSARLIAVGVISFVPTAHSYRPYPAGNHTSMSLATWRKNPQIHSAPSNKMLSRLH